MYILHAGWQIIIGFLSADRPGWISKSAIHPTQIRPSINKDMFELRNSKIIGFAKEPSGKTSLTLTTSLGSLGVRTYE